MGRAEPHPLKVNELETTLVYHQISALKVTVEHKKPVPAAGCLCQALEIRPQVLAGDIQTEVIHQEGPSKILQLPFVNKACIVKVRVAKQKSGLNPTGGPMVQLHHYFEDPPIERQHSCASTTRMPLQMNVACILKEETAPVGIAPEDPGDWQSQRMKVISNSKIGIVFRRAPQAVSAAKSIPHSERSPSSPGKTSARSRLLEYGRFQRRNPRGRSPFPPPAEPP